MIVKISVGMPVYNGAKYLTQAIESILNQSLGDFELIISDNCSTDGTEEICRAFQKSDGRIRYYKNESNIGAARNYNRVFKLATAKYFRWANADDISHKDLHKKCYDLLEKRSEAVLSYGKTILIDKDGLEIKKYNDNLNLNEDVASERYERFREQVGLTNIIYGLMRTTAVARTSLMGNFIASDVNFMAELCLYGKFIEIPEYLFSRRIHPDAVSWDRDDNNKQTEFWDPHKNKNSSDIWRQNYEYLTAVVRAPIKYREKLRVFGLLSKYLYWQKKELF